MNSTRARTAQVKGTEKQKHRTIKRCGARTTDRGYPAHLALLAPQFLCAGSTGQRLQHLQLATLSAANMATLRLQVSR